MINPKIIQEAKTELLAKANGVTDTAANLLSSGSLEQLKLGVDNGIKDASNQVRDIANGIAGDIDIAGLGASAEAALSNLTGDLEGLANKAQGLGAALSDPSKFLSDNLDKGIASLTGQLNQALDLGAGLENALAQGALGAAASAAGINLDIPFINKTPGSDVGTTSKSEQKPAGISKDEFLPNQLRKYASFNTIFQFGAISANSINFPDTTYLVRGADVSILRSGGGGIDNKRVMTIYDALGQSNGLPGNLEYFIDDFQLEALIAPNKSSGMAQAMPFSFKVHEPYSMGLFLQSLQAAALESGFDNYLKAPFMLEIDFIGWDDEGNAELVKNANRKIPMSLVSITFDVERSGSVYEINAVPWNEVSLMDEIQTLPSPVQIVGTTLLEALSLGEQSLSTVINSALEKVASAKNISATDYYMIRFPTKRTSQNGLQSSNIGSSAVNQATTSELEEARTRLGAELQDVVDGQLTGFFDSVGTGTSGSALFENLKSTAVSDVSSIGSALLKFPESRQNSPFGLDRYTYDKEAGVYNRAGVEISNVNGAPAFTFDTGASIQTIIEELVTISSFGREALEYADREGMIRWYKIEPQCFIIPDKQIEKQTGKPARIFVFNIVPYEVHSSVFPAPNSSHSAEERKKQIVKEYNYIYSGQNEDVLAFDIKFNAAFFEAIQGDFGELSAGEQTRNTENIVAANGIPAYNINLSGTGTPETVVQPQNTALTYVGGSYNLDRGAALAKQFQRALLDSDVDLIVAELEIWGDPYYLPSSGLGNYNAANSGQTTSLTVDGSLDYQRSEVDILINFKTPIDYGPDGYAIFPGGELAAESVGQFSGVYKVLKVVSSVRENMFVQTLSLIRRKNQEEYTNVIPASGADAIGEDQNAQSLNKGNEQPRPETVGQDASSGGGAGTPTPTSPGRSGDTSDLTEIRSASGQRALVAKVMAPNFQALVDELEGEYGYVIKSMGGYRNPIVAGINNGDGTYSKTTYSWHNAGLAIDINPAENPFKKIRKEGRVTDDFTDMPLGGTGSAMVALAAKHGLGWGGNWSSSTDAMHFSAGRNEQGTFDYPKDGTIPKFQPANVAVDNTDDAKAQRTNAEAEAPPDNPDANDPRGLNQTNTPPPANTVDPDANDPRGRNQRTSGTAPVTTNPVSPVANNVSNTNQTSSNDLRPYLPLVPQDNRYDFRTGDKIRSIIANRQNAQNTQTNTQQESNTAPVNDYDSTGPQ